MTLCAQMVFLSMGANMKSPMVAAVLAACFLSSPAWSENFTVGVEEADYLPIYKGDSSNYVGYARELLDTFAGMNGHVFIYKAFPVARLHREFALRKALDFKYPDNPYWSSDLKENTRIFYSKGTVTVVEGLMVLPANKGKGKVSSIATIRGFTPYPYLDRIKNKEIVVTEANSPEAAINMGEAGRVDAVYIGTIPATYIMREFLKKPGVLVFDDKLPSTRSDFSFSSIAHPEIIKQFDDFLVKERDTVARLKTKYKIVE